MQINKITDYTWEIPATEKEGMLVYRNMHTVCQTDTSDMAFP